jgi:hypothetical protein
VTTPQQRALRWLPTFLGFPLGGVAAELISGPVDTAAAALVGGVVTGAVLGAVQAWGLRLRAPQARHWTVATALGLGAGLTAGASAVGFGTETGDLVVQGAVCGLAVGAAQSVVLRGALGRAAALWAPALGGAWALGWAITASIGVDVETQYTVFGSSGALAVTALTVVLPLRLAGRARERTT